MKIDPNNYSELPDRSMSWIKAFHREGYLKNKGPRPGFPAKKPKNRQSNRRRGS